MLPDSAYAKATINHTPSSDLSDYTHLVDLSNLSQSWWDEVNTSTGARGRTAKDDGTELATHWIDFDDVAQTGWIRVLWTGTTSSSGGETLRIYPPQSANSEYLSTSTFGSEAVYPNETASYTGGNTDDLTGNGHDGTSSGSVSTVSGLVGDAWEFDGGHINVGTLGSFGSSKDQSLSLLIRTSNSTDTMSFCGATSLLPRLNSSQASGGFQQYRYDDNSNERRYFYDDEGGLTNGNWKLLHFFDEGDPGSSTLYVDGSSVSITMDTDGTLSNLVNLVHDMFIGGFNNDSGSIVFPFDGDINFIRFGTSEITGDHAEAEYEGIFNNDTYWNTWSLVEPVEYNASTNRKVTESVGYNGATERSVTELTEYNGDTNRKITEEVKYNGTTLRTVTQETTYNGSTNRHVTKQTIYNGTTLRTITQDITYNGSTLRNVHTFTEYNGATLRVITEESTASYGGATNRKVTGLVEYSGATNRIVIEATGYSAQTIRNIIEEIGETGLFVGSTPIQDVRIGTQSIIVK